MKKSQMQSNETILVLFIFFIILIFGFIFYSKIQNVAIERQQKAMENLNLIEVSKLLKDIPELSCSQKNAIIYNCYDLFKIDAFNELLKSRKDYFSNTPLFNTNITVYQYDPYLNKDINMWNIYDNPLNNSNIRKIFFPIEIYDPVSGTNSIGIVEINYYVK